MNELLESFAMAGYSALIAAALVLSAPWWLARMLTSGRYRAGLGERLGRVPAALAAAVSGRRVVWVHAVSVGEVLAATRLVAELEARLGAELEGTWRIVISTTTATGQALARERFKAADGDGQAGRVFYYPLDFAWAVRAYLRALKPELVVLMESEIWPRMLVQCNRRSIPVAVVNARVSDRSFTRGVRVRAIWASVLRRVSLFLAQSEQDAQRLVAMGARESNVRAIGNLKYDVRAAEQNWVANLIRRAAAGRPIIVAGSTVESEGQQYDEERMVLAAWRQGAKEKFDALLVLAPRHPERFELVEQFVSDLRELSVSSLKLGCRSESAFAPPLDIDGSRPVEAVILDTVGDLAAVYGIADVAFVGGSLVPRGGHNPLEPAQFGVPVVMGPSYENFRDIVANMQAANGIRIVEDDEALGAVLAELLTDREDAKAMGQRGRAVFEAQSGATARAVDAVLSLLPPSSGEVPR